MMYLNSIYKYIKIKIFIRANLFLESKDLVKKSNHKGPSTFHCVGYKSIQKHISTYGVIPTKPNCCEVVALPAPPLTMDHLALS